MNEENRQTPGFEHLYYIEVEVDKVINCGKIPEGKYMTIPITGGWFEGERMKGSVLPMGADWNTMPSGLRSHVSTRYVLRTDDGTIISLFTDGRAYYSPAAIPGMMAGNPDHSKYYFRQHLMFRAGNDKYAWLNDRIAFAVIGMTMGSERRICYDAYMLS